MIITNERDNPLLYNGDVLPNIPTIVVELTTKWYSLYLLHPNGSVESFEPDPGEVGYKDNTYNPMDLVMYAQKHNYVIDELSFEMIIGRWEIESKENYANYTI